MQEVEEDLENSAVSYNSQIVHEPEKETKINNSASVPRREDHMKKEAEAFEQLDDTKQRSLLRKSSIYMKNNFKKQHSVASFQSKKADESLLNNNKIKEFEGEIKNLTDKTSVAALDDLFDVLQLNDQENYRKKMKGFIVKTFFTANNQIIKNPAKNTNIMNGRTAREVKRIIELKKREKSERDKMVRIKIEHKELQKREKMLAEFRRVKEKKARDERLCVKRNEL